MIITDQTLTFLEETETELMPVFTTISRTTLLNQSKVLDAFQHERIGTHHFQTTSGYGYHDPGREALERVYSRVFKTEASLVRQQLVSGTHAITCAILGNLSAQDELLIATGAPYETLLGVLGIAPDTYSGISKTAGFAIRIIPLLANGKIDITGVTSNITNKTKMVAFQRSCGYSERNSFSLTELSEAFNAVKQVNQDLIIFVDNCYGEFVGLTEPTELGADLIAGSLIKNPGGCLVPSGGYISGKAEFVEKAAERLYVPGIGSAIGPSLISPQLFFQGFFEAPHRVGEMLKGATLAARVFQKLDLKVAPLPGESRSDIIQKVYFHSEQELIRFCQLVQKNSPIESDVTPEPAPMPGYHHKVIMGGGTFISGSTSEFSADAPLAPPYTVFLQGGLSYSQVKLSLAGIYQSLFRNQ